MNEALWNRLEEFSFDKPGVDFSFSERLRHENQWSAEYTERVLMEYRRFLYLCVEAGHPVTPSDAVDQAWHLHLCYTRSYWEDLCRDTLRQPVHHGPTEGGTSESEKFTDWYEATLRSYEESFGQPAPDEIWPTSEKRFRPALWQRIDRSRNFVLSKRVFSLASLACVFALLLTSCSESEVLITFFGALVFLLILIAVLWKNSGGGGGGKGGDSGGGFFFGCGGDNGCGGSGCGGGCGS